MILRVPLVSRPSLLSRAVLLLLATDAVLACGASHICTLVGCVGSATITYSAPIQGAYTLDLKAGTTVASGVACPSARATPLADGVTIECTATSFTLSSVVTDSPDGGPGLTTLSVTISDPSAVLATNASVPTTVASTDYPNGPDCGGACYDLKGELTLAH